MNRRDGKRRVCRIAPVAVAVLLSACSVADANGGAGLSAAPSTAVSSGTGMAPTVGQPAGPSTTSSTPGTAVAPDVPRRQLEELKVAARGSLAGYSRDKFPHWAKVDDTCNTREVVLKRNGGPDVKVRRDCYPVAGTWTSPYDGATWTHASDVDVDHVVPLAQSWVSGAKSWTQDRRTQFANDLTRPELKAVTDDLNQAKGDRAPDEWKPPLVSFWCQYATDWITVKHFYLLTITAAEKAALVGMLDHCRGGS